MATVKNEYGVEIDFAAAVELMNDDIREEIEAETEQEFFSAYCEAHRAAYGEEWELAKANPVY